MRGNIRRRSNGSWTIQVYAGKDPETGRKRYVSRTVQGSKKDAEAALAKLIRAQETGLDLSAAPYGFGLPRSMVGSLDGQGEAANPLPLRGASGSMSSRRWARLR